VARQFRTGDQTLVRELNRSIILNQLRTGSRLSRADLAAITGLNKTTVSSLVEELLAHDFVREIGPNASAGGRPAVLLEINPAAGHIIGVEIGVGYLAAVLTDFRAAIEWRRLVPFAEADDQRRVMNGLVSLLRQAIQHARQKGTRLLGVGISIPGLVDVTSGSVVYAPNLDWHHVPVRNLLSEFDVPIYVDNDANAAALGERYFGAAQQVDNFVYVVANVGLGTGIVLGGHIFQGASGYAGEAGHTTLDPDGPLCHCGNRGCWERLASQRALIERVQQAMLDGQPSLVAERTNYGLNQITIEAILEAARQGDQIARHALHETGLYLGLGIANLIDIFNPSLVVFGGALGMAEEFLAPVVRQVISERAMAGPREVAQFVVSAFKSDACVIGGVALVMHDILSRPRFDFAPLAHRRERPATPARARVGT